MSSLLAKQLERDIRNQVVIDQMKKLDWKGKLMIGIHRHFGKLYIATAILLWLTILFGVRAALAEDIKCPTPGEPCKVLTLTPAEQNILMQTNGILDTAAQARNLDLGQFSVYLKTRIAVAPAGEMVPKPESAKPEAVKSQEKAPRGDKEKVDNSK